MQLGGTYSYILKSDDHEYQISNQLNFIGYI